MREVLRLLDPAGEFVEIKVEGVPFDEIHKDLGDHAQAVDVTLARRPELGGTFHYAQLKYSSSAPNAAWTWSRLLAPRTASKPQSSVLGKLAGLLLATGYGGTFSVVTNQPLADEVRSQVGRLAGLGTALPEDAAFASSLANKLGLEPQQLIPFLRAWDLAGFGATSRLAIETEVVQRLGSMLDADARSDAGVLQQRVSALILPENRRHLPISRDTLLVWLGEGSREALFPSPSQISAPSANRIVRRRSIEEVVSGLRLAVKPMRLHAGGGCGKTVMAATLTDELPAGSELFLYDCYGGGLFLASDQRRHRPERAFTQLANEMAARLRTPFVIRREGSRNAFDAFRSRVAAAADLVKLRGPDALLVICFDAVDNARVGARRWVEPCFLDELAAASGWPENVRILVTCRTGRREEVGDASLYEDLEVLPFDVDEVQLLLDRWQPTWSKGIARTLHDLTGGFPRRLVYAIEGLPADSEAEAVKRLMPRATGIDPLFEKLVAEAGVRLGEPSAVWTLLCALAHLSRPVPAWVLAELAGIGIAEVADVAVDVGGIVEHAGGWSFQDEDFEHFVDERTSGMAPTVIARAADLLSARRGEDRYAAAALAEVLVAAGRLAELYALVRDPDEATPSMPRLDAQQLTARRLALALRSCRQAADIGTACELMIASAEATKRDRLIEGVITGNLDLSTRFASEAAMRLVLAGTRHRKLRPRLRISFAATLAAGEPGLARDHLRWWFEHLRDAAGAPDRGFEVSSADAAAEFEALAALRGSDVARDRLRMWRSPELKLGAVRLLAARNAGADPGPLLEALEARRHAPAASAALLAAALLAGARLDEPRARRAFLSLARAFRGRWPRAMPADVGQSPVLAWHEATLTCCEHAVRDRDLSPAVAALLDRLFPKPGLEEPHHLLRLQSAAAVHARALALREELTGERVTIAEWLPPKRQPPPGSRSRRDWSPRTEKSEEERWNEALGETTAALTTMLEAARATLAALSGSAPADEAWTSLQHSLDRSRSYERRSRETGSAYLLLRHWMVVAAVRGDDPGRYAEVVERLLEAWGPYEIDWRVDLASALGHAIAGHDAALGLLVGTAERIEAMPGMASERARRLCDCARTALPLDAELARTLFDRAIDATAKVDAEVMSQLAACGAIAKAGLGGERAARAHLVERLADAAGAVNATLDMGSDFPWGSIVAAVGCADLATGLATAARWRDHGLVPYEVSLPAILETSAARTLTVAQRHAMAVLCGPDRPALGDIATPTEVITAATAEAELRDRLNDGAPEPVRELVDFLEKAGLDGVSNLRTARATLSVLAASGRNANLLPDETDRDDEAELIPIQAGLDEVGGEGGAREDDLDTPERIRSALASFAGRDSGQLGYLLPGLADRVRGRAMRVPFLREVDRVAGSSGRHLPALPGIIERWRDYPPVAAWARDELPKRIISSVEDVFGWGWHQEEPVDDVLNATGLPPVRQAEILLDAVAAGADGLHADAIFTLAGVLAGRAEPERRNALLGELLNRTRDRTDHAEKVTVTGAAAPEDNCEAVARLLFATMGDVDRGLRWRAAHAALALILADDPAVAPLVACLDREDEPCFSLQPFYLHAAREQLVAVLLRGSLEAPGLIARHADLVLNHVRRHPHLTTREMGRELLIRLADRDPSLLGTQVRAEVERINRSQLPAVPAGRRVLGPAAFHDEERKRGFDFDTMDTIRYWYQRPAFLFGMGMEAFLDRVEGWVHGRWGYGKETSHWAKEPRLDRISSEEHHMSNRQGTRPSVERLSTYLEWHAMMCAVGELIETHPLAERRDRDDAFGEWLSRHLPSIMPGWSSDLRTPPPLEARFRGGLPAGGLSEEDDEGWRHCVPPEAFDDEIGKGPLILAGGYEVAWADRRQNVTVRSALVTPGTAAALATALVTARDHMDFILPSLDDDHEIEEDGFRLTAWLLEEEGDGRMDRDDERRGSSARLPIRPALDSFGLRTTYDPIAHAWRDAQGREVVGLALWGDRERTKGGGWRLTVSQSFVEEIVRASGLSIIVSVEIARTIPNEDRRTRTRWRLYVLDGTNPPRRIDRKVRGLGAALVRREGMSHSVDTLGRWLLHRAAELSDGGTAHGTTEAEAICERFRDHRAGQRW